MAALAGAHDSLSGDYTLAVPPAAVAAPFLDKRLMRAAAARAGLDLPLHHGPADRATAEREFEYPVVVKPVRTFPFASVFGVKLFAARSREQLLRCVERLERAELEADVYELVPGEDECFFAHCTYVDGAREPAAGLTVHKLRQGPPLYGDARVAEVVPDPDGVREATVELLRGMGHRGIASAEFKRDARDGRLKFIEVNGRSFVYNGLVRRAGLDLAALAWADYTGERPGPQRPRGWRGSWIHLHPDLLHSIASRRVAPLTLRDFIAPYRGRWIEAVWSARDPLPFAAQWVHRPRRTAVNGALATTPP
jgi:predicted ATP-grasp superfamily ATP-dependent carboligase